MRYARIASLAAAVLSLGLAGCVGPEPRINMSESLARVTTDADAIVYREEGEPVDVGANEGDSLSLRDAIRRTLSHDPAIQVAIARVRLAQAESRQARLLPNPVLSIVFRFPESGGETAIEAGLAAELVSLLSRPGRASAADNRLRVAGAAAVSVTLDVIAEVKLRYVGVQALDAALVALDERMQIVTRLLELARSRLRAGEGSRLDVVTLETQQVELEAEISDRQLALREERLALARLLGEPSGDTKWQLVPWARPEIAAVSERGWVESALANRPEVQAQQFELAALGADLSSVRFSPFDSTSIGIDAERDGGDWSVGPGVSIPLPLFDFGQARRDRARSALEEGRHNLTRLQRQVVEETRRAFAAFTSSQENLERIQDRLIPLAQQRLEQAENQFKAGQIDVTGLLLAEQDLRAARIRLVELQRRTAEALIRLQRAAGSSNPTSATTGPSTRESSR